MVIPVISPEALIGVDAMNSRSNIENSNKSQSREKEGMRQGNLFNRIKQLFSLNSGEEKYGGMVYDPYGSELDKAWEDFENGNTV